MDPAFNPNSKFAKKFLQGYEAVMDKLYKFRKRLQLQTNEVLAMLREPFETLDSIGQAL